MKKRYFHRVQELTEKLVRCPSVMATPGERKIARYIYEILEPLPYFQRFPQHLNLHPIPGDPLQRMNISALVEGRGGGGETLILLGHLDTVRIEDFTPYQELAFSPLELKAHLVQEGDRDLQKELESGDWMLGRGVYDMKSGLAAHLVVLEEFAASREDFSGNLLFLGLPDEEDMSTGAIHAVDYLNEMQEQGFIFTGLINGDYTSPRYPGDTCKYVYLGTVGKILPSFFVAGRETHVGQSFEGFDPNLLTGELTRLIDLNTQLSDGAEGEYPPPPVSLKVRDLKAKYDVQTPFTAQAYYNFFTQTLSPPQVMAKMKEVAQTAFERVIMYLNQEFRRYCSLSRIPFTPLPWEGRVYSYQEFYQQVLERRGRPFQNRLLELESSLLLDPSLDLREHSLRMVEEVYRWSFEGENHLPCVIIYFSSAFSPRVYMKGERPEERRFITAVKKAVHQISHEMREEMELRYFYPYISDMSFFALSDDETAVESLKENMPAWGKKYSLAFDGIKKLNLPQVNMGPYGRDAHKMTERVYMPYSFEVLPALILETVKNMLGRGDS